MNFFESIFPGIIAEIVGGIMGFIIVRYSNKKGI